MSTLFLVVGFIVMLPVILWVARFVFILFFGVLGHICKSVFDSIFNSRASRISKGVEVCMGNDAAVDYVMDKMIASGIDKSSISVDAVREYMVIEVSNSIV